MGDCIRDEDGPWKLPVGSPEIDEEEDESRAEFVCGWVLRPVASGPTLLLSWQDEWRTRIGWSSSMVSAYEKSLQARFWVVTVLDELSTIDNDDACCDRSDGTEERPRVQIFEIGPPN